jgi:hypothetical protein
MLISSIFRFGLLKYHHRSLLSYSRCFVSNSSQASALSKPELNKKNENLNSDDQKSPTQDSNEWLWAYLRDRKTFADLSEEQRRKVVEIG